MPRPKNKSELLATSEKNLTKLWTIIDSLDDSQKLKTFKNKTLLNKNIRDVLCHLHHWHLMFLEWYKVGMKNKKPEMPAKGYKWSDLPALNKIINETYQKTSLEEGYKLLKKSHKQVVKIISSHTNEELFTKKMYSWTGSTSLGAYLISCTASHYDWAFKTIKKGIK